MRLALTIASFVVLAVHGVVFYDQFFHKWERHQTAYFDQARALSKIEAERNELAERSPKIEQILVTQFGETRVDRCTTCHIASDDPRFQGHFQPLKTHPYVPAMGDVQRNGRWERRHKFSDFGCTVCHDGQGRGLEEHYSHGKDPYWPNPLLGYVTQETWKKEYRPALAGAEFMEAACAQCHTEENFPGAPWVNRGRKLFFDTNCYGCHKIEGLSEGTLAPELTEAGRKFKVDYLWESVVDPRANLSTSFMPKFKLTRDDTKALVIFLKSRQGVNLSETSLGRYRTRLAQSRGEVAPEVKPVAQMADAVTRGKELLNNRACLACHKLGEKDGGIAPDLSFEGLLKDETWILEHFTNPRSRMPDSIMPAFRFAAGDFKALASYLGTLKTKPGPADGPQMYKVLCARCHGDNGDGKGPVAIYLDPSPRDLTKASFMTNKPVDRFLGSIREGVPGTSMPAWKNALSDEQIRGIFEHVEKAFVKEKRRELKAREVPERNPVAASKESITRGETTFLARCTGCHGRKADGKGPNSLDIDPHPRNLRNVWFVERTGDRRLMEAILYGVQGTAMPPWVDYGLSKQDAGDLVNYIRSLNPAPKAAQVTASTSRGGKAAGLE